MLRRFPRKGTAIFFDLAIQNILEQPSPLKVIANEGFRNEC
jgi:hypothetical protein